MTDPRDAAARRDLRNYAVVTAAYWADTVADGAVRMLVFISPRRGSVRSRSRRCLSATRSSRSSPTWSVGGSQPGGSVQVGRGPDGSKNALKGVGFFVGALLLTVVGFRSARGILAALIGAALIMVVMMLRGDLDRPDAKAKFSQMFSNNRAVNVLAAARIFLFASRDVWFVIALPVFFEAGPPLVLLRRRWVPRGLDDRLRTRSGVRSCAAEPPQG
jgi:hypothetical protein